MSITKHANWTPATLRDGNVDSGLPFILTPRDRDTVQMCRIELEAMKRHRDPEGLEVGEVTEADWLAAREAFRVHL
jgi:hypothetical protein